MTHTVLQLLPSDYSVAKFARFPFEFEMPRITDFFSVTITCDEVSFVGPENSIPAGGQVESGWRCLKLIGIVDFSLTGVLTSIIKPLSDSKLGVFAISTFNTDYVLVKKVDLDEAIKALSEHGMHLQPD